MPWATREKHRAYQRKYNKTAPERERHKKRKKARRLLEKDGTVKKHDGKDINHKKPLSKGGGNGKKNLSVTSRKKNRGYKRGKPGNVKS
jgi:hypothetical protein